MTILVLFHTMHFRDLKSFYLGYVCQHLRRHRLTEAAAARHTAELLLRAKRFVHHGYQPRLVHILAVVNLTERIVPLVNIYAHNEELFTDLRFTAHPCCKVTKKRTNRHAIRRIF